jgi:elongation factor G
MMKLKYSGGLIEIAVEPRSPADQELLVGALTRLAATTIGLAVEANAETGQLILHGQSERQLEEVIHTLKLGGIEVQTGNPQIAYLETLQRPATGEDTHHRSVVLPKDVARVVLRLEPSAHTTENVFVSEVAVGSVPPAHLASIENTVRSFWREGPLIGERMIGTKVTLLAVECDDIHTSEMSVASATRTAFKDACKNAKMRILEPIMSVEVVTPEDFTGSCIGDMNSRRGAILGQTAELEGNRLSGEVPLGNLFGYESALRSMTNGRASFTMTCSHHDMVPHNVAPDDPRNFPPAVGMRA